MMKHLPRRGFLQVGGACAATAIGLRSRATLAANDAAASFTFAHLTDMHVQPELGAVEGFRQCIARVNALTPRPDFVITGGDLIMDALAVDRARLALQWKLFDDCCRDFAMPVHHTIGNHDVVGWSKKALIQPSESDYGKRIFADRYGEGRTYRSFDHQGWHFILLDSIGQAADSPAYIGLVDEAQVDWLRADLERVGKATPIVVVTHIPFFSVMHQLQRGPTTPVEPNGLVTNAHELHKLLKPYNVQLVLSGHGHVRERITFGKTTFIQSGAVSGLWWKGPVLGDNEAFGVVTCRANDFDYRFEEYGWQARKPA